MDRLVFVLGALREEINLIRGQMTVDEQFKVGRADAWSGNWEGVRIILVRTGIGKDCALSALEKVLSRANPSLILSIGYAGGLDPKLKVGDVILADHVLEIKTGLTNVGSYPIDLKRLKSLEGLACPKKIVVHRGILITVNQVVDKSSAKQELGSRYNALAVDMETAPLVAHATHNNLSFLSVRAVSDTVEQSLVDVSSFISDDGEASKLKAGWYAMTHPHRIKSFISLRMQSQQATRNMTEFIGVFMRTYRYSS